MSALTWLMWAYLWFLFFLSMGMNKKIDAYIGRVAMVQSWLTLTLPALLSMMGIWKSSQVAEAWIYFSIAAFVYFAYITVKLKKASQRTEKYA